MARSMSLCVYKNQYLKFVYGVFIRSIRPMHCCVCRQEYDRLKKIMQSVVTQFHPSAPEA